MTYTTLISTFELADHLDDPNWVVVDCRYSMADPPWGQREYLKAHIAGAQFIDIDQDLSSPVVPDVTGRHPLPSIEAAVQVFSRLGIAPETQVVAYDDAGGALAAVRLWWVLRWLGHDAVAVLDGGLRHWIAEGRPVRDGIETVPQREFRAKPRADLLITLEQADRLRQDTSFRMFDARTAERYHGWVEPFYAVAGHIPGAFSAPFTENLTPDYKLRPVNELKVHYQALIGDTPPERVIFYCGSGITAVHDILAMMVAGLGEARLYAGSWSEWIADPLRPVARDEPEK